MTHLKAMESTLHEYELGIPLRSATGISHQRTTCQLPAAIHTALQAAVRAGEAAWGTTSPNPPVGAAVVTSSGEILGVGGTQPVGGAHAEVQALAAAGAAARGQQLVVTLEPCNHTGRTGPCTQAIVQAGITKVWFCQRDPGAQAGGGSDWLAQHGITCHYLDLPVAALEPWLHCQRRQTPSGATAASQEHYSAATAPALPRPYVIAKLAHTLDGRIAASDGSSQWITGESARAHAHAIRSTVDAIVVGTGTVLADNPRLTARYPDQRLREQQPQPVIIGTRAIPAHYHLADAAQYADLPTALAKLSAQGKVTVLIEGGAQLVNGALQAGCVDELHLYTAPAVLGSGASAYPGFQADNIEQIRRFRPIWTADLYPDICRIVAPKP